MDLGLNLDKTTSSPIDKTERKTDSRNRGRSRESRFEQRCDVQKGKKSGRNRSDELSQTDSLREESERSPVIIPRGRATIIAARNYESYHAFLFRGVGGGGFHTHGNEHGTVEQSGIGQCEKTPGEHSREEWTGNWRRETPASRLASTLAWGKPSSPAINFAEGTPSCLVPLHPVASEKTGPTAPSRNPVTNPAHEYTSVRNLFS